MGGKMPLNILDCPKAVEITGPSHATYGYNDSGWCYCVACTGSEEDIEHIIRKLEEHKKTCTKCQENSIS